MADNDIQKALEQQVADLRGELKRITKSLSSQSGDLASDLRNRTEDAYEDAQGRLRHTAQAVRDHGQVVAETIRENPGTATTLFGTAGILGVLIGVAIGCAISDRR
ncbi:hypothetical protein AAIB41_05005 [Brucella sp. BE17]|uniref:DUF883 family protein n=1 Tax=Brucella sp. BE17 TaxID=3142977 RepID=UPI0031BB25FC